MIMSIKTPNFIKRYALLTIAFICSLFIPFLLYSIQGNPLDSSLLQQQTLPYEYPPMVKYSYQWPKMTSFSSSKPASAYKHHSIQQEKEKEQQAEVYREIDRKYCGKDRCKFILPVAITEQESKAQLHFRQLAFLSGKINRTIVLPNVHNSHLGACLPHSFDFYYDEAWLKSNADKFNYITMDNFKSWLLARHYAGVVPTGQEVYIQGSHRTTRLLKRIKNCFQDSFDFSGRPTVNYQVLDRQHQQKDMNLTKIMMSLLSDEARQYEYLNGASSREEEFNISPPVDVINLFYDRRYKFIQDPKAQSPIPYNKRWIQMADNISSSLKPFIAIHWRMERLEPVSNLLPCAKDLVDEIHTLEHPLTTTINNGNGATAPQVFLLTDYPHLLNTTGARPESNSFYPRQLKPEHHEAISYLYNHLNISLTTIQDQKIHTEELPQENWHLIPIDTHQEPIQDRSILGIIDKLVAMKAQWFFAGRPGVCAKSSSFTGRISQSRSQAFKSGDKNIIVPIKTFNLKKEEQDVVKAM